MKKVFLNFVVLFLMSGCNQNEIASYLKGKNIDLKVKDDFKIVQVFESPAGILANDKKNDSILRIQLVPISNELEAQLHMDQFIDASFSQFRFTEMAFSGKKQEAKSCHEKFRPLLFAKHPTYITSYVDERLAICICLDNEPAYLRGTSFYISTKKDYLIIVEYFIKQFQSQDKIESFLQKNLSGLNNLNIQNFSY